MMVRFLAGDRDQTSLRLVDMLAVSASAANEATESLGGVRHK